MRSPFTFLLVTICLPLGLIVGCAGPTVQQLRDSPPSKTYRSASPVEQVADCIVEGWEDNLVIGLKQIDRLRRGDAHLVTAWMDGKLVYLAEVHQLAEHGTEIRMHEHNTVTLGFSAFVDDVERCAAR
jgi:hypothetical protein